MNFTLPKKRAVELISLLKLGISRRVTMPILRAVWLETDAAANEVRLRTTDLDREIRLTRSARVAASGALAAPFAELADLLPDLPDGDITFTADADHLIVAGGARHFRLPTQPTEEFPRSVSDADAKKILTMPTRRFFEELGSVAFAMSRDSTRYTLNCVWLHEHDGALAFTACSGPMLARRSHLTVGKLRKPVRIEDGTVEALLKLPPDAGMLTLAAAPKHLFFSLVLDSGIALRLTAKHDPAIKMPHFAPALPATDGLNWRGEVACASLRSTLDFVAKPARRARHAPLLRFQMQSGRLAASLDAPESACHEELSDEFPGPDFVRQYRPELLLAALKAAPASYIRLAFPEQPKSCLVLTCGDWSTVIVTATPAAT